MNFKKIMRIIFLVFLILLALCGIGLIPPRPSRDFDNEIKIELVEERDVDEEISPESEAEKKA
jgi:hypothetical protein